MENITDDMIQNLSPWNDGIKPGDITKTVKESACEQAYQVSPRYLNG